MASPCRPFSWKGSITVRQHAEASFYQWAASISPSSRGLSRPSPAARDHRCCRRVTAQSAISPPLVGFVLAETLNCPPIGHFCKFLRRAPFPLSPPNRFSSSIRKPELESRLLNTGHHVVGKQVTSTLFPESKGNPGFDAVHGVSMRHQRFICIRLSNPCGFRGMAISVPN